MQKGSSFLYWIKVVSLGIVLGLGLQFAQAWTAPTQAPPLGNVGGPVTLGDGAQYKTGKLGVNSAIVPINAFEVGGGGNAMIGGNVIVGGNVGIGTIAPTRKLHIKSIDDQVAIFESSGNPTSGVWFRDNGGNSSIGTVNGDFRIATNGNFITAPSLLINTSGNVGIGTTNPGQKLSIGGNIESFGAGNGIIFPDGTKQTTAAGGSGSNIVAGCIVINGCAGPCGSAGNGVSDCWGGAGTGGGGTCPAGTVKKGMIVSSTNPDWPVTTSYGQIVCLK